MHYLRYSVFLIIVYFLNPLIGHAQADISVSARQAVLIEQSTGRILYEKNAHEIASIASITKIMTAIIAIESGKMDEITRASRRAVHTEGSAIYLEQGEKMLIKDLVYGLMLRSGNDSAIAISEHVAGSVEGFVHLMNEKADWLGMTNTMFDNPHGLDSDKHYSTAFDMALLLRYAIGNETFKEISGTISHQASSRSYAWQNKNKLLTSLYEYCTGGKTGFTKKTGRTLSTSASKDNLDLIAVTLNAPDDWRDHIQMYEWGFKNFKLTPVIDQGMRDFIIQEKNEHITGFIQHDFYYPLSKHENGRLNYHTVILDGHLESVDDKIGKTIIKLDNEAIYEMPVFKNNIKSNGTDILVAMRDMFKQMIGMY